MIELKRNAMGLPINSNKFHLDASILQTAFDDLRRIEHLNKGFENNFLRVQNSVTRLFENYQMYVICHTQMLNELRTITLSGVSAKLRLS